MLTPKYKEIATNKLKTTNVHSTGDRKIPMAAIIQ
jgi:hypothetical protein